jgi:putative ABC transport system permease protein
MMRGVPLRLAARELRGGISGFYVFVLCLLLGVATIAGVGSIRQAIMAGLARDGAALLGGDAEISLTYRFATPEERLAIEGFSDRISEITDFRSMAMAGDVRGLTQVKAVDGAYPLVGKAELTPAMPLSDAFTGKEGLPGAVMAPALIARLGLQIGDRFTLGKQEFVLMAALAREPDASSTGFTLGPRTLVRLVDLEASGLLGAGSLFDSRYRLDLRDGVTLDGAKAQAEAVLDGSGMRWKDARNGAPGIARFVERLGMFLLLVGLSGLAVGGIGISAATHAFVASRAATIATLRTFGAERRVLVQTYALVVGAMALLGIVIGLAMGVLAPLVLGPIVEMYLPVPAVFQVYAAPLLQAAAFGVLATAAFTVLPLARIETIGPASLFRDAMARAAWPRGGYLLALLMLTGALLGLAALFSGSWKLTLGVAFGLLAAMGMLAVAAFGLNWMARFGRRLVRGRPGVRWALASLSGPKNGAASTVMSLGLGLTVLAAIGQIEGNLRAAIRTELPEVAPSYFLVDIQKTQVEALLERLQSDPGILRVEHAPMIRGVITEINGRPAAEVAGEHWVIRGDRGLTYADAMPEGTKITAGEWWPEGYAGEPLISFAAEEAAEIGLKIGDTLTVNVLGREVSGRLSSFKEVDFSNAGMGFVLTMNKAALVGAPHTFIATVYADAASEAALLKDLGAAFPNVTAIRVKDAIDQASELLAGVGSAIRWGASTTLLTGFLVLIGAVSAGAPARVYEAAILKTLGGTRAWVLGGLALRSVLMGFFAGSVALLAGLLAGWATVEYVMELSFRPIWPSALGIIATGILGTLLTGIFFAWAPLASKPAQRLRSTD